MIYSQDSHEQSEYKLYENQNAFFVQLSNKETIIELTAGLGIEPRFTASKAAVLPLDDPARIRGVYPRSLYANIF
jgi:hypothetical protein